MQIPVFDTQFGNCEDADMIWKQKQNYLGFVVPVHQSVLIFNQYMSCLSQSHKIKSHSISSRLCGDLYLVHVHALLSLY